MRSFSGYFTIRKYPYFFQLNLTVTSYRKFSRETTADNWKIILDLAYRWSFPEVKALAINALEGISISLVDRIGLYQKYNVAEEIIYPHYAALCARPQPITLEETEILGVPTTLMIFLIRERLLSQSNGRTVDRFDGKVFLRSVNSYFESQKKQASTPKDEKLGKQNNLSNIRFLICLQSTASPKTQEQRSSLPSQFSCLVILSSTS